MKRNVFVSVVRLIVATRSSGPPASQPVSCLTRLSADLSVIWLRVPPDYFLWRYQKGRVHQNKPRTTDALKAKNHRKNSSSDSGRPGMDFQKYGVPGSILSGRKWWPLPPHVIISSHFLHNEVSPLQVSLQYPH